VNGLTLAQRRLLYPPCKTSRTNLLAVAEEARFTCWENSEGQAIGWYRTDPAGVARYSILLLHGNAGCAPDWFHYADAFQAVESIDFFIMEYPGYGGRAGPATQTNILRAAEDALENIPTGYPIFLVGESMGTGVATWLAGKYDDRISGVFLVAPYDSMTAVAKKHLPLFPVKAMLRDKYPSSVWLDQYRGPLAVLLAGKDKVIPPELGRALFENYRGPKKLWVEPKANHNEIHRPAARVWKEVVEFWKENSHHRAHHANP
jgi:pimeloyl-ACP methyl ester carboxylesterase